MWIMVLEREVRRTEGRVVVVVVVVVVVAGLGRGRVRRESEIEENVMVVVGGEWEMEGGALGGWHGRGERKGVVVVVEEEDGMELFGIRRL